MHLHGLERTLAFRRFPALVAHLSSPSPGRRSEAKRRVSFRTDRSDSGRSESPRCAMEEKASVVSWDEAFRVLSTRWSRRQIRGFDAEDLAQEALARVWVWLNKPADPDSSAGHLASRATLGPPRRVLMGFAHRLEKECIRDRTRTQCRFIPLATDVYPANCDEDGTEIELRDEFGLASPKGEPQPCVSTEDLTRGIKLKSRDRNLLGMLAEGLGTVELSANLHCSEAAVDSRKRRLFAKIRAVVDPTELDR